MNASSPQDIPWPGNCDGARIYLRPVTVTPGAADQFELILITAGQETRTRLGRADLENRAGEAGSAAGRRLSGLVNRIESPRAPVCGLGMDRPRIMGVINVTPDSFSDGGKNFDSTTAIARLRKLDKKLRKRGEGLQLQDRVISSKRPSRRSL